MQLVIRNAQILQSNGTFLKGHVGIEQGIISALRYDEKALINENADTVKIDAENLFVCPGFIDTHVHGGVGFDFGFDKGSWEKMEDRLSANGVTSILATLFSLPPEETLSRIDSIVNLAGKNRGKVSIEGIHVEGPFFNKNKKGIHREENIRPASVEEVKNILDRGRGLVKILTLAPDIEQNMALIKTITAAGVSVSIAHTEADYVTAMAAFSSGANRVTHTFNTMPVLSHRYEGIVTAAWQHGAFMELISDGQHVSPTIVKMFVAASDFDKIVLVSDNFELSGLPEGKYVHDNRPIVIADGQIKSDKGVLAGSMLTLNECAYNLVRWGFPAGSALKMASENPARSIGIFDRKGSIACGKDADIAVLDGQFNVMMTVKGGKIVYQSDVFAT